MEKLKDIDYRILFELMRNSKISDRQLARKIGVSQPTVTRRRARLEKEVIDDYTAIPKWGKLGYEILAITFVNTKSAVATKEMYDSVRKRAQKWLDNQSNVILATACRGMGVDSFMISIHRTYADYDDFLRLHRLDMGDLVENVESVIVNLAGKEVVRPLSFKYLAQAE